MQTKVSAPQLLISLIRSEEDYHRVLDAGFSPADFGPIEPVFGFLVEYWQRFKNFPDVSLLRNKFPAVIVDVEADFDYALEEMRQHVSAQRVEAALLDHTTGQVDLSGLISRLEAARKLEITKPVRYSDAAIDSRLEAWETARDRPNSSSIITGLRTGIRSLDATRMGLQRSDLICLFARPETGKTFISLNIGVTAWLGGHKVLFISPEMSTEQIEGRFDGLVAGQQGITISQRLLRQGRGIEAEDYGHLSDMMRERRDWRTVDGSFTVEDVKALALEEKPRLLIVDGIYLLDSKTKGQKQWERITEISGSLKRFALDTGMIILMVNQAVRDERLVTRPPQPTDMAGGDSIVRDSDKLLSLYNHEQNQTSRYLNIVKDRAGGWSELRGVPIVLDWRLDQGIIRER